MTDHTNRYLLPSGHEIKVDVQPLGLVFTSEATLDEIMSLVGAVKDPSPESLEPVMPKIPDELCGARKPAAPQLGERCVLLPHADWMPHSWVPWSLAIKMQERDRPR